MEDWQKTSLILCGFGFLKELRPSDFFITEYFISFKNITAETVIHDLYPIGTYSILGISLVVFLVTDFLRYRPVVIIQGISFVLCWITAIWGETYFLMLIVQFLYGIAISTDVAYYTYIYAKVDKERYQQVTSYTYAACLIGKFLAGFLAQILVSFNLLNFRQLVYITLSTGIGAFLVSIFLPPVNESIYFNRISSEEVEIKISNAHKSESKYYSSIQSSNNKSLMRNSDLPERLKTAYEFIWVDFKDAYSKTYVLKWSIWWAFAYAGNLQVMNYAQSLWKRINSFADRDIYNGGIGALQCLLSALLIFAVGHIKISWRKWGEPFLCLISVFQGLILIWMSQTDSLYTSYATYVMFRILYQLIISIASSEVAQGITKDSCGLVFGINTFIALIIQTILTLVVTDKRGLALDEVSQFFVYGCYFLVLGFGFLIITIYTLCQTIYECRLNNYVSSITNEKSDVDNRENQSTNSKDVSTVIIPIS